jgi:general secretion pathway protein E
MISKYIVDYSLAFQFGIEKLRKINMFPISKQELFTLVATIQKPNNYTQLQQFFNTPIKFIEVSEESIKEQLENFETYYEIYHLGINALINSKQNHDTNSYIINMTENIIALAIKLKSSDIHIEALKQSVAIRFRIDGVLKLMFNFQYELYSLFASIIKLFASLDISQVRLPQNGRFSKIFDNHLYDFRISTIPILNGESIVIRILDSHNSKVMLKDIGFNKNIFNSLNRIINLHQGMILVTGPTGSGKTTTLYAILNTLNTVSKKIITIEDPVEYNLIGIQQININEDIGLNWTLALKNILRQDPDIIMIGEIRDENALQIAIRAALTGHLVIATLHTNNAPDTITRLLDLNAEPFLIASTLKAVISQRLVRKLSYNGGYSGRIIVAELLECDNTISKYISKRKNINTIIEYAKTIGYITLEEDGMQKVKDKITTLEEFYSRIKI